MHFRISSSLNFQRKTKRYVFLLLLVLTPVYFNWPSNATGKCYRSPRQLILTMKHWWLYINIHSLTIFKWKMRNLRLNLIYLSFFVQYMYHIMVILYRLCLFEVTLHAPILSILSYVLLCDLDVICHPPPSPNVILTHRSTNPTFLFQFLIVFFLLKWVSLLIYRIAYIVYFPDCIMYFTSYIDACIG